MDIPSPAIQSSGAGRARALHDPGSIPSSGWSYLRQGQTRPGHGATRAPLPHLPDPTVCHVRWAGFGGYADCLVDEPFGCQYALGFGGGFFCLNPQRHETVTIATAPGQ